MAMSVARLSMLLSNATKLHLGVLSATIIVALAVKKNRIHTHELTCADRKSGGEALLVIFNVCAYMYRL